jgi:hypothetical protein
VRGTGGGFRSPSPGLAVVSTATLLALAGGAAGCGDEEPPDAAGDGSPRTVAAAPDTTAPAGAANGAPQARRGNADGTVTRLNGQVVRDWGDKRERKKVVAIFAKLQRDFRAGRMAAACDRVTDFGLQQFQPGKTAPDTPCPAKLRAFAAELGQREPQRLRLLWVRAYPTTIASAWVRDERGKPVRVPFYGWDGKGWKLELGNFARPEFLNAELVGAGAYLRR